MNLGPCGLGFYLAMSLQMNHRLLIYHRDPELYEEAVRRRAPRLEIYSTEKTEEALSWVEEAEIILAWKLPDDLLKRAGRLANVNRKKGYH